MKALLFCLAFFFYLDGFCQVTFPVTGTVTVNGDTVDVDTTFCSDSLNCVILLDNSGSTAYFLAREKQIAKQIVGASREYSIIAGNHRNKLIIPPTTNKSELWDTLSNEGGTSIDTMVAGREGILAVGKTLQPKRAAFLLTDGGDLCYLPYVDSLLKYNISLYVVNVDPRPPMPLMEQQLRNLTDSSGGLYIIDTTEALPLILGHYKVPCAVTFDLDSCEPLWHIVIGSFDTTIINSQYAWFHRSSFDLSFEDSLEISGCDTLILITATNSSPCGDLTINGVTSDSQALFRTVRAGENRITLNINGQDTALSIFVVSTSTPSYYVGDTFFVDVPSFCDSGVVVVRVQNTGCVPVTLSVLGSGAFTPDRTSVTDSVTFSYYPVTGNDTSIYTIGDSVVYLIGTAKDTSYVILPDSVTFTRTLCDSTPEFYPYELVVRCDTSDWIGVFDPIMTEGLHREFVDDIWFLYTVTNSKREEKYLDSCGGGYILTIGCDTTVAFFEQTIDTVRGLIAHEYLDSQRVRLYVNLTVPYTLISSTDLFVLDWWRDEGIFYLGKDSVAIITAVVEEKPCTVYLIEPDTIYYQYLCGDRLLKELMSETFAIYPNPTTGAFSITPNPESIEIFYDGKRVDSLNDSGAYVVVINHRVVLKLVVEK